jgi:hypothetical protein
MFILAKFGFDDPKVEFGNRLFLKWKKKLSESFAVDEPDKHDPDGYLTLERNGKRIGITSPVFELCPLMIGIYFEKEQGHEALAEDIPEGFAELVKKDAESVFDGADFESADSLKGLVDILKTNQKPTSQSTQRR